MRRLKTLAILWTLGAAGRPVVGAEPAGPAAAPKSETPSTAPVASGSSTPTGRPEPPVPPIKYLEAGANLFNKGRFETASRYFTAAETYRDRLTANERIVLDVYQEKLAQHLHAQASKGAETPPRPAGPNPPGKPAAVADANVVAASTSSASRMPSELSPPADPPAALLPALDGGEEPVNTRPPADTPVPPRAMTPGAVRGTETWRDTTDVKQKARWLLHQAREQIFRKQFDAAERSIAEADAMGVNWGFFDITPKKATEALAKARAKAAKEGNSENSTNPDQPRDRRTAKARLREARAALASGRLDDAERIASDVRSWGLRYGLFDDTPDKLASDLAEARRREGAQDTDLMVRSFLGINAERSGPRRSEGPAPLIPPNPEPPPPSPRDTPARR